MIAHSKNLYSLAELLLSQNNTETTLIGWISTPAIKVPRYARIFDGSIGFEQKRGFVPGLYEFFISLRPEHYQQGVHKDRRGNKLLNIAEVILNTKENRSL